MIFQDLAIIVVAGGSGSRYGVRNKLLEPLAGMPVFAHALCNFGSCVPEGHLILVVGKTMEEEVAALLDGMELPNSPVVTRGGASRAESVRNGLAEVPEKVKYVAICDAARPLGDRSLLAKVLEAARECGGAVAAHRVTDTIKRVSPEGKILETIDRNTLAAVETPQVFEWKKLQEAWQLAQTAAQEFTDDAAVMEFAGFPVQVVFHEGNNEKLTFAKDLPFLESCLRQRNVKL